MRKKRIKANANHHASSSSFSFAGILDRSPYAMASEFIEPATDERPVEDIARNMKNLLRQIFRGKSV